MNQNSLLKVGFCCTVSLFLVILMIAARPVDSLSRSSSSTVLIESVYPDGLAANDIDEAIRLVNISQQSIDMSGWGVSDSTTNLHKLTFPAGTLLEAQQKIWITKDANAFRLHFGFDADFELSDGDEAIPNVEGSWPGFANSGDEVLLADAEGALIDVLVYENGTTSELQANGQWEGGALEFYGLGAKEGQILSRKLDQSSFMPLQDTDSSADWIQDEADPIWGRRVLYPGWDIERFAHPVKIEETAMLTVAIAPDNAFDAVTQVLEEAQESIWIETQTFESHDILTTLLDAADRGVDVKILLEGGPPGGVDDSQRYNCFKLEQAGGYCYAMMNDSAARIFDRYTFLHAKFMIIDGEIAIVGSDNLSPNSWPADDKGDGTFGRRGVVLLTDAAGIVTHLEDLFLTDLDLAHHHDVSRWLPFETGLGLPLQTYIPLPYENGVTYTVKFLEPQDFSGTFDMELIQAPENFLTPDSGLLGLLAEAGKGDTILVEQQYERLYWGDGADPVSDPNVRLASYLKAARQGSKVEILLDAYFDDERNEAGNWATCKWLNQLAAIERLDLICQLGNPAGLGIHNKMVLAEIDGDGYVHVGSINGSEQSAKGNREVALQVQSDGAYAYLAEMFRADFVRQAFLPTVLNGVKSPADYLLLSEILYNPFGATDGAEFIELVNPTGQLVDLSGWSVSDAVLPEDFADLRRFPAGTELASHQVLVIAQQAVEFEEQFFMLPDFEILDSHPDVPELIDDLAWGSTATFFRLGNSGDVVFLRDTAGRAVDVFAYGEKQVEGVQTCPLLLDSGTSYRRNPFTDDTDLCTDFQAWASPTPGEAP